EYIWSMRFDCCNYRDFDGVYFEVWKRVAKQKVRLLQCAQPCNLWCFFFCPSFALYSYLVTYNYAISSSIRWNSLMLCRNSIEKICFPCAMLILRMSLTTFE
ncbi:Os01g0960600, partial [Oryza sativa Japonica Group]